MSDGKVEIETVINTSGIDKGLKDVNAKLGKADKAIGKSAGGTNALGTVFNEMGGEASNAANKLMDVASAGGVYAAAAVVAIAAGKKMVTAARECAEALKVQEKAEVSLQTAAKNNPYLDGSSVKGLISYASELQSMSNFGDEELIPMMTKLAASGRTQDQIMQIMSASVDMAASGAFSLDSAVSNLNKTYGGLAGELGESVPELKSMTAEQMKNGDAVKLMAEKYKGMSTSMADARIQAKNAQGDFKEAVGQITQNTFATFDQFWKNFWENGTGVINKLNAKLESLNFSFNEKDYLSEINTFVKNKTTGAETTGASYANTAWLEKMQGYLEAKQAQGDLNSEENQALILIKDELGYRQRSAVEEKKQRADAEARAAAEEKIAAANKTATDAKSAYTDAIKAKEQEIEIRRKTGEVITDEAAAQELYKTKVSEFLKLAAGFKDVNNIYIDGKNVLDGIVADAETLNKKNPLDSIMDKGAEAIGQYSDTAQKDTQIKGYQDMLSNLDTYHIEESKLLEGQESEKEALDKKYLEAKKKIQDEINNLETDGTENTAEKIKDTLDSVTSYFNQVSEIINTVATMNATKAKEEQTEKTSDLQEQLDQGVISEEEYYKKKKEIDKKAAKEEYKAQIYQWSANLLQIALNTATGIANCLSKGYAGIPGAVIIGALGTVQTAAAIQAAPKPPAFATGGFLTGPSTAGDKIAFNGNAGEAILNAAEQRNFMDLANGKKGSGLNLTINNNAANLVSAKPQTNNSGDFSLVIDSVVQKGLASGKYNSALTAADKSKSGKFYGL